jgi:hypothetical protein
MLTLCKLLFHCLLVVLACHLLPRPAQAQSSEQGPISLVDGLCPFLAYQGHGPTLPSSSNFRDLLCADHQFRSPSGVYTALLQGDGVFVVVRGDPTNPANLAWQSGKTTHSVEVAAGLTDYGDFIVYRFVLCCGGSAAYLDPVWSTGTAQSAKGTFFAKLSDEGTFTINSGTLSAPGKQIFSNNVNDPVVSVDITSITYDFAHTRVSPPSQVFGASQTCINRLPTEASCNLSLALNYTKTNTFTFTANQSISLGFKSTTKLGVPGVGEQTAEWSIMGTAGFTEGKSDAESEGRTFTSGVTIPLPASTTYKGQLVGELVDATIPFTYTGTATYKSGKTATVVDVSGIYNGVDTGQFTIELTCVRTPGGCPNGILANLPAVASQ